MGLLNTLGVGGGGGVESHMEGLGMLVRNFKFNP